MVSGQRRAGEVVEAPGAGLAAIALPMRLGVIAPVADYPITAAPGTAHALGPAMLAHQCEALGVVQKTRKVDQVGCRHDPRAPCIKTAADQPPPAPQHPGSQQEPHMIATVPFRARFLQTPPHGDALALR